MKCRRCLKPRARLVISHFRAFRKLFNSGQVYIGVRLSALPFTKQIPVKEVDTDVSTLYTYLLLNR